MRERERERERMRVRREGDRGVPVDGNLVAVQESEHNTKEGGGG